MRVIAKRTLREFWERHPDPRPPLEHWYQQVRRANWDTPAQITRQWPRASIVGGNRVVFRIKGNQYRLVVEIFYPGRQVFIKFISTHAKYDPVNVAEV